jgi:hypothetical protein
MGRKSILAGLLIVAAGLTAGIKYGSDANTLSGIPMVERYRNALKDNFDAESRLRPRSGALYIPQSKRPEYSNSQAHSKTENNFQRLKASRGLVRSLKEDPDVKEYVKNSNISNLGYIAFIGGSIFSLFAIGNSINPSRD